MAEDSMSAEQPTGHGQPDQAKQQGETPYTPDLPVDDLTKPSGFIGLPQILRRAEVQQRRAQEADERFTLDLELTQRIRAISEIFPTSPLSEGESIRFYNPDDVLTAYKNSDANDKKRFRSNIRTHLETRQRTVLGILTADLRMLYADQGLSEDEIDAKIEGLTTDTGSKKRRHLAQLPKEAQVRLLENMAEERQRNLISNFDQYMYVLSFSNPFPFTETTASDQQATRDRFAKAGEREKTAIAADVRQKAKVGLRQAFEANLERLGKIELDRGYKMPLIKHQASSLREMFNKASLPRKAEIVSEVQEEKLNLITHKQLLGLLRLRKTLERSLGLPEDEMDQALSDQQKAQDEVERIIILGASKAASRRSKTTTDIEIDETREVIRDIATAYENPELVEIYELVLLLRLSHNDFFKF